MAEIEVGESNHLEEQDGVDGGEVVVGHVEDGEAAEVGEDVLLDPVAVEVVPAEVEEPEVGEVAEHRDVDGADGVVGQVDLLDTLGLEI